MGLCIKTPFGGTVVFEGCDQNFIDKNFRLKPEDGSGLRKGKAVSQSNIDAIYFPPGANPSVIRIPDNCRADITCDGKGGHTIAYCCNIASSGVGYITGWFIYEPKEYAAEEPLPDASWPKNNQENCYSKSSS